ncbi:MAG: hypothetical protein AAF152_05575 [Cyanobacteria bacterium P01_A01_bin.114]
MVKRIVQAVVITLSLQMVVAFRAVSETPATQAVETQPNETELVVALSKALKGVE